MIRTLVECTTPSDSPVRTRAREFAKDVLRESAAAARQIEDPVERFTATRPAYEQMIAAGFLKDLIPAVHGGGGLSAEDSFALVEELSAADPGVTLTMLATTLGIAPLLASGTDEQRQRFLAPFLVASGAPLAAFAFSEPGGSANFEEPGPDAGLTSTAVRDGAGWRIDGAKNWISNAYGWDGNGPDLMTIVAADSLEGSASPADIPAGEGLSEKLQDIARKQLTVFAVPRATPGISFGAPINTIGLRTHLLPRVRFTGVNVRDEDRIGEVGTGAHLVDATFGGGAGVGALALGVGEAAFSFALAYARTEKRGGTSPIINHQSVQFALTDAKISLEAARALVYRAAGAIDARSGNALDLSIAAKIYASETVIEVITGLMRVVGVESFSDITPLALFLNDALSFPLIGGSNNGFRRRQFSYRLATPQS